MTSIVYFYSNFLSIVFLKFKFNNKNVKMSKDNTDNNSYEIAKQKFVGICEQFNIPCVIIDTNELYESQFKEELSNTVNEENKIICFKSNITPLLDINYKSPKTIIIILGGKVASTQFWNYVTALGLAEFIRSNRGTMNVNHKNYCFEHVVDFSSNPIEDTNQIQSESKKDIRKFYIKDVHKNLIYFEIGKNIFTKIFIDKFQTYVDEGNLIFNKRPLGLIALDYKSFNENILLKFQNMLKSDDELMKKNIDIKMRIEELHESLGENVVKDMFERREKIMYLH